MSRKIIDANLMTILRSSAISLADYYIRHVLKTPEALYTFITQMMDFIRRDSNTRLF